MKLIDFFSQPKLQPQLQEDSPLYCRVLQDYKRDPEQDLFDVQRRFGLDGATQYFYFAATKSYRNKIFRKIMAERQQDFSLENQKIKVLIVPPPPILSKKSEAAVVEQMRQVSLAAGFGKVEIFNPEIKTMLDGALKLKKEINECAQRGQKIMLFSFSYGSAAVRFALDKCQAEQLAPILGWVNLSGLLFGSPHFNLSSKKASRWSRNQPLLRSYSCEQKYFIKPLSETLPPMISFLGVQLSGQMPPSTQKHFFNLRHWGPNDGMISFLDYQNLPGFVVPLWGHGHHVDIPREARILQKSLCYLVDLAQKQKSKNWVLPKMEFEIEQTSGPVTSAPHNRLPERSEGPQQKL